jgi:hypothetical protein
MHCWEINETANLDTVLDWCVVNRRVDRALVTARESLDVRRTIEEPRIDTFIREHFADVLRESFWATAWPGTTISNGGASKVYMLDFNESVAHRMVTIQNNLSSWNQWNKPPLPADPCLFKTGDSAPTLVSVTHEGPAWFGAWLFDSQADRPSFVTPSERPLRQDFIPDRHDFVVRARQ